MGQIEPFRLADVSAVAYLHRRVFHRKDKPPSEALITYYRRLFFENPWQRLDLPSLVWRESNGDVTGFFGVVPRPMFYGLRPIIVATGHRLMVSEQVPNASFVAARLVRACFGGKQDLFISDGADEDGRRVAVAGGGVAVPQYSMRWICPVRPLSWFLGLAGKRRIPQPLVRMVAPIGRIADRLVSSVSKRSQYVVSKGITSEPINEEVLLECIERSAARLPLRPSYDLESLRWMLSFIGSEPGRGVLDGFALRFKGALLGSCLYYANHLGGYEVIAIAGTSIRAERELLNSMLKKASAEGATHVFGRFEPRMIELLWELRCHLTKGCWAIVHASDPRMVELVKMGDIFLSNLEAELWLGVPMSYDG